MGGEGEGSGGGEGEGIGSKLIWELQSDFC